MTTGETITTDLAALRAGETTSVELTRRVLTAADSADGDLGVFVSRFAEQALSAAAAADAARARGDDRPLLGIPFGVKDVITTEDGETTAQSLVLDRCWGRGDAAAVHRLRAAGAVIVGKTTTLEYAIGAPDPNKPFPAPRNPWDLSRWAGGSSSGSASGIATGMMLGALGTDTGGSVRTPSALSGVTGLRPTFGRVPKSGCVPLGYTLDCIGPMARSARDCARTLGVLAGDAPDDPWAAAHEVPNYLAALGGDLTGLRVGVDRLTGMSGIRGDPALEPLIEDVVQVLRAAGAKVVDIELPYYRELCAACVITLLAEAFAYHAPDLRTRWDDYFADTRIGLGSAAFISGTDYVQAQRIRRWGQQASAKLFTHVDLVLSPTVAQPAPPIDEAGDWVGSLFAGRDFAYHTAYWNALGYPALAMPMGFNASGLPLSAQLAGPPWAEPTVLRAGDAFQQATDWHLRLPTAAERTVTAHPVTDPAPGSPSWPERERTALGMLDLAGLAPPADEAATVASTLDMVRENADLLYRIADARYTEPGLLFRV